MITVDGCCCFKLETGGLKFDGLIADDLINFWLNSSYLGLIISWLNLVSNVVLSLFLIFGVFYLGSHDCDDIIKALRDSGHIVDEHFIKMCSSGRGGDTKITFVLGVSVETFPSSFPVIIAIFIIAIILCVVCAVIAYLCIKGIEAVRTKKLNELIVPTNEYIFSANTVASSQWWFFSQSLQSCHSWTS